MTPRVDPVRAAMEADRDRVTVDDLRHKALAVRDTVKAEARAALDQPASRYVIAGAVVLAVAFSVAYFMGTRSGSRRPTSCPPPRDYY